MVWTIEVSAEAERDADLLFDHLADSYVEFGESRSAAAAQAVGRIDKILDAMERIATAPYRGEVHDELLPGLRHLSLGRAIYWYQLQDDTETILVLAIFYGGQDHIRQMLLRLLREPTG
ncbi:type II toxin-antitoxin system RelE/ParE family toxin [Pseudophaeobacter sp.]|uniref:type II toxin-antitoxin system RelE/ParE family toxin n=1 Tax=Pseudophaeobacter sp. TaxID=1971739 RepID=UPI003296943A